MMSDSPDRREPSATGNTDVPENELFIPTELYKQV